MGIKVKKVEKFTGVHPPRCYKCKTHPASFYYVIETDRGENTDVPLCNVCLSAFLNYLDNQIIQAAYNNAHPELYDVK
jgi:protein-arginine kinase activator protein McsA